MPGPLEIIVILVVVLLLFGAKRLPEIGRALGEGIREFKRSIKGLEDDGQQEKKKPEA
ncbi:MAG: twin-arginine translocase TatA/TatE family subunit [Candidatus Omnitrophica bacterium]|nr:twin-arginine translocase TatA/TatE family subunit [Candidatus Omnitrophota bacterium]